MKSKKRLKDFLYKINKNKTIFYTSRILAIAYIAFITLFAFDSKSFVEGIIHLLPTIMLIGIFVWAIYRPKAGGIAFFILGLIFTFAFKTYGNFLTFIIISFPLLIIGILFFIYKKEKRIK